ncbi:hypothetical protein BHE74_00054452 [Ensete ventricosum]|nr:hypothetical protein GW17_00029568 [Ensete ventricosum]RWW40151.1 hypothetical protein BHE74_00054452 [Ensete ventricosum]
MGGGWPPTDRSLAGLLIGARLSAGATAQSQAPYRGPQLGHLQQHTHGGGAYKHSACPQERPSTSHMASHKRDGHSREAAATRGRRPADRIGAHL